MAAEQLSVELVAEFVGRDAFEALKREVAQIKNAMNGLGQVQDTVRQKTSDAEKAVRQQRQAFSQSGMQLNQFFGQIAAGTPVTTALVQQMGDLVYVAGQAGDSIGKVGRFLGGPLATGLLIGASLLIPLIARMKETKEASNELDGATASRVESESNVRLALAKTAEAYMEIRRQMYETAKLSMITQKGVVDNLIAQQQTLLDRRKALREQVAGAGGLRAQAEMATGVTLDMRNNNKALSASTEQLTAETVKLEKATTAVNNMFVALIQANGRVKSEHESSAASAGRQSSAVEKLNDKMVTLKELMSEIQNSSAIFGNQFVKDMDRVGESIARSSLESLGENVSKSIDSAKPAIEAIQRPIDRITSMSDAMGRAFSDGIKGMITGAMSFKQVMGSVIDSVINKLFEMFIVQQITGMIAKGISSITGITLPGKAIGGPVQAGKPYVVGERGPEMFVPSRSGSIVPNNKMGNGMVINVDARGASDPAAVRMQVEQGIAQAAPYIIAAAQNRTLKTASRPRLPGTIG